MLSFEPVKKLSAHMTSSPRARSRSQRWEPMNPAPPVTSTRFLVAYSRLAMGSLMHGRLARDEAELRPRQLFGILEDGPSIHVSAQCTEIVSEFLLEENV